MDFNLTEQKSITRIIWNDLKQLDESTLNKNSTREKIVVWRLFENEIYIYLGKEKKPFSWNLHLKKNVKNWIIELLNQKTYSHNQLQPAISSVKYFLEWKYYFFPNKVMIYTSDLILSYQLRSKTILFPRNSTKSKITKSFVKSTALKLAHEVEKKAYWTQTKRKNRNLISLKPHWHGKNKGTQNH